MGSVLSADRKLGGARAETVGTRTTAILGVLTFLLTVLRPEISSDKSLKSSLSWRPTHKFKQKKSLLLPTECKPEGARQQSSFVIYPPATNLQLSVTGNGNRNENDVTQMSAEDESYILTARLTELTFIRTVVARNINRHAQ